MNLSIYFDLMSFTHGILLKAFSFFIFKKKQRLFQVFPPPSPPPPHPHFPSPSFYYVEFVEIPDVTTTFKMVK